jgi:hypothetical protein
LKKLLNASRTEKRARKGIDKLLIFSYGVFSEWVFIVILLSIRKVTKL